MTNRCLCVHMKVYTYKESFVFVTLRIMVSNLCLCNSVNMGRIERESMRVSDEGSNTVLIHPHNGLNYSAATKKMNFVDSF